MSNKNVVWGLAARRWAQVSCALLALNVATRGSAQQSADTSAASGDVPQVLQEVVVTAEKRESTVQATPISITAISGADLQARGLSSVADVARETPGISFRSAGPGLTEFRSEEHTSELQSP